MNDKELLENAAKSYGIQLVFTSTDVLINGPQGIEGPWNPLTDDGDALRLAVKLNMGISIHDQHCMACAQLGVMQTVKDMPTDEATRRAIVQAAAEIGKNAA